MFAAIWWQFRPPKWHVLDRNRVTQFRQSRHPNGLHLRTARAGLRPDREIRSSDSELRAPKLGPNREASELTSEFKSKLIRFRQVHLFERESTKWSGNGFELKSI